ncbi:hypothetical protein [Lewinella sp. JB7]|uniref:hypothetical protein n=1 Tax=Lewinella sp. JB7 TaxID=2962887 RepID=UPI0020C99024|nr:hypothetical protein [Lewinella sp. JB7]MCP9237172.1 hypothetical protein [Lewinella sp. JB7]
MANPLNRISRLFNDYADSVRSLFAVHHENAPADCAPVSSPATMRDDLEAFGSDFKRAFEATKAKFPEANLRRQIIEEVEVKDRAKCDSEPQAEYWHF